ARRRLEGAPRGARAARRRARGPRLRRRAGLVLSQPLARRAHDRRARRGAPGRRARRWGRSHARRLPRRAHGPCAAAAPPGALAKLKSTYVDTLPALVDPATGRLHTSFNQTVAATGRLSSSDPNLQNIPIRSEEGRRIRAAFVAAPGHRLVSADYSQIELRVLAHLSGDQALIDAFASGEDIHARTAAEVFADRPPAEGRRLAKVMNYGIVYGMGAARAA